MPYTDSVSVIGTLPIRGVWIHDPTNPEGTARNFIYGENSKTNTYDPMGAGSYFSGRSAPVFDYGDPEGETIDVMIEIPYGPTHAADLELLFLFARNRRPVWFRDMRGRAMFGTIGSIKNQDQAWGAQVSFIVTKAHREIVEVTS